MHLQIWSYYYAPEPMGIAPISATLARSLQARGHHLSVVAAHPNYPEPRWGRRRWPYREILDGVEVTRLPLWIGRRTAVQRVRQEATYVAALLAALPALSSPDVQVVVSPSFLSLIPAILRSGSSGVPWLLWLQDILPEGAITTGLMDEGLGSRAARALEQRAYTSAGAIAVISDAFSRNLREKGVPAEKIRKIYNPATLDVPDEPPVRSEDPEQPRLLAMGNIGLTQNLPAVVEAFQRSEQLRARNARLIILGAGVQSDRVRAAIDCDRVELLPPTHSPDGVRAELLRTSLGLVTQRADLVEFNLPSKLSNFMAFGVPILASISPSSETAGLIERSGGGWVTDAADLESFIAAAVRLLDDETERRDRGRHGHAFAQEHLSPDNHAAHFEQLLTEVGHPPGGPAQHEG